MGEQGKVLERQDANLDIQIDAGAITGYAAIQNNIPIVRGLTIQNRSDEPLAHVELRIHCEPAFAEPQRFAFDVLKPGESRHISPIDLKPDHSYPTRPEEGGRAMETVLPGAQYRKSGASRLCRISRKERKTADSA